MIFMVPSCITYSNVTIFYKFIIISMSQHVCDKVGRKHILSKRLEQMLLVRPSTAE
jgi:hypothetical protein